MGRPKKNNNKNIDSININLLKEIINILSQTEKKVKLLHDYTKKDFSSQNKHLKQHFNKIKTISDNSINLGALLKKSIIKNLSNEISDFQIYISSKSESFNKRFKNHIKLTEEIKTKVSQLADPLKSYKLNTIALKSIIAGFKINFAHLKNKLKLEDPTINEVEALITKMNTIFPLIDESLKGLNALSESLHKDLIEINKKNLLNFSDLLYKLSLNNMEIIGMIDEKTSQAPELEEKAKMCFKSIDKIISYMQVQDIINQKTDHFKQIHFKLITELKSAESSEDYNIDLTKLKLSSRIPEIAELQVAQLIYTDQEYKTGLENIKSKFIEIAGYLNSFAEGSKQFTKNYIRLDKDIMKDLQTRLNDYIAAYEVFNKFKKKYAKDLKSIDKLSDDIYGYLTSLNSMNANIEHLTFNIIKKHFSSKDQKDVYSFAKQIEKVSSDNNKELHSVQYVYTSIQKNTKFLLLSIDNTRGDVLMLKKKNEVLDSLNNNFAAIKKEYPIIMNLLKKNILLSHSLSKEILPQHDDISCYDSFNKTIEELIFNLNHIHKQLIAENIDINQFKRDLTKNYKGPRYSTPSEIQSHNRTLNRLKGKNILNNNLFIKNKKENEVELF